MGKINSLHSIPTTELTNRLVILTDFIKNTKECENFISGNSKIINNLRTEIEGRVSEITTILEKRGVL